MKGLTKDSLEQFVLIVGVEGRKTAEHFVNDDSEAPPVHRLRVGFFENDLWSHVFGSSTETSGFVLHVLLTETEICDYRVPVLINQDVLRL
jgi:hypothetical protein